MMKPLGGRISDRLRKLFPGNAPEWSPPRPAEGAGPGHVRPAVPDGVHGESLGGRNRRRTNLSAVIVAVGAMIVLGAVSTLFVILGLMAARQAGVPGGVQPGRGVVTTPFPCSPARR